MGVLKTTVLLLTVLLGSGCAWLFRETEPGPGGRFADYPEEQRSAAALTQARCTRCHEFDRVFEAMSFAGDRADIEFLVEEMADRKGSGISQRDEKQIVDFLDYYRLRGQAGPSKVR